MGHPATSTSDRLKWGFWIFSSSTVIFIIWMKQYLLPLQSGEIIRFEMAKTAENAAGMTMQWKENGKFDLVVKSVYLDYIFIVLYTIAIALACRFISELTRNSILKKAGVFFSILIFVAGIFDVAENMAMMKSLGPSVEETYVGLAYKMAISKFSIVLMALFFVIVCFVSWLADRFSNKEKFWK